MGKVDIAEALDWLKDAYPDEPEARPPLTVWLTPRTDTGPPS